MNGFRRKWIVVCKKGGAADELLSDLKLVSEASGDALEDAHGFGSDFRANAIAGECGDLDQHGMGMPERRLILPDNERALRPLNG